MLEQEIKKYYDGMAPSDKTVTELLADIRRMKKKRAAYKLAYECLASAAACFMFAVIINYIEVAKITSMPSEWVGTALSKPNGYLLGGILLAALITAFVVIYRKNMRNYIRSNDKKETK